MTPPFIEPDWPAPPGVHALSTTRQGGVSQSPYASLNLGHHVGDDPASVAANRNILAAHLPPGTDIQWLQQVHGTRVVEAGKDRRYPQADACISRAPGMACAILTADCLPVLLCDLDATIVAAAHAGWRGLLGGVLESTLAAMDTDPRQLLAWLGPAIGPTAFEVGPEVHAAFTAQNPASAACFSASPGRSGHHLADLCALARQRLGDAGLTQIYGGGACTLSDESRFFSYRRDGETGRMATLISLI